MRKHDLFGYQRLQLLWLNIQSLAAGNLHECLLVLKLGRLPQRLQITIRH